MITLENAGPEHWTQVTCGRSNPLVRPMWALRELERGSVSYPAGQAVLARRRSMAVGVVQERGAWAKTWDVVGPELGGTARNSGVNR